MKYRLFMMFLSMGVLLLIAGPMSAHHASSLYDHAHPITLSGAVTEYVYMNPHVHILFDVKEENGETTRWTAEAGPPHGMFRSGWTRDALKPGDKITVTGFPFKDGKKMLNIMKLAGPGGSVLSYKEENES